MLDARRLRPCCRQPRARIITIPKRRPLPRTTPGHRTKNAAAAAATMDNDYQPHHHDGGDDAAATLILELPPPPLPLAGVLRAAFERLVVAGQPHPHHHRIYVLMHGAGRPSEQHGGQDPESISCTPLLLDELRRLFAAAASAGAATADVVPVLPFAHDGRLPPSGSVSSVLSLRGDDAARELARLLKVDEVTIIESPPVPQAVAADDASTAANHRQPITFPDVAVGGTFDRLHAGHRLLLAATALVATERVFAGVTADALLQSKKRKELLEPYERRCGAAEGYMRRVRPGLVVRTGALRDPNEPTQAELDPAMRALVVSKETIKGGEAINEGRGRRGFEPLALVVVGLVGDQEEQEAGVADKISSTALREREAAAGGGGG